MYLKMRYNIESISTVTSFKIVCMVRFKSMILKICNSKALEESWENEGLFISIIYIVYISKIIILEYISNNSALI